MLGGSWKLTRRSKLLALAIAAVAAIPAAMPAASAAAPTFDDPQSAAGSTLYGIHEPNSWRRPAGAPSPETVAQMLAAAGAESHRWTIPWNEVERDAPLVGLHRYDFSDYDAMYEADLANGIRPLIALVNAPPWAFDPGVPQSAGRGIPPAADHLDDWAAFAARVVQRYPEAVGIEIWNEPNLPAFWGRGHGGIEPDPARYVRLLASAHEAIKDADPSMTVVGGAISNAPRNLDNGQISGSEFARSIFAEGAAQHMDVLSVHAYPTGPGALDHTLFEPTVEQMRAARGTVGSHVPIWITEAGTTTTPGAALVVSEQQQADALIDLFAWVQRQPDIGAFFVHTLTEPTASDSSPEKGYALLRGDNATGFEPKPAFLALAAAAAGGPGSGGSPAPSPVSPPVAGALELTLDAPGAQALGSRRLTVTVRCSVDCEASGSGRLRVSARGRSVRFGLNAIPTPVASGEPEQMSFRIRGAGARRAIRVASRASAKLRIEATAADGSTDAVTQRFDLRG